MSDDLITITREYYNQLATDAGPILGEAHAEMEYWRETCREAETERDDFLDMLVAIRETVMGALGEGHPLYERWLIDVVGGPAAIVGLVREYVAGTVYEPDVVAELDDRVKGVYADTPVGPATGWPLGGCRCPAAHHQPPCPFAVSL